ncbi:MAG: hypothetical protein KDD40_02860 [Bdellovibrionales bacterium]|nr:hypothetical protein [Bdellovibrionales bacterium]
MNIKLIFLFLFIFSNSIEASVFNEYTFINGEQAKKKWGYEKLDKNKFRESGSKGDDVKAKMAAYILENQSYKGKKIELVYKELGKANGFFISDIPPTYILQRASNSHKESWQLAFIPTNDGNFVEEVKIVKTCCNH